MDRESQSSGCGVTALQQWFRCSTGMFRRAWQANDHASAHLRAKTFWKHLRWNESDQLLWSYSICKIRGMGGWTETISQTPLISFRKAGYNKNWCLTTHCWLTNWGEVGFIWIRDHYGHLAGTAQYRSWVAIVRELVWWVGVAAQALIQIGTWKLIMATLRHWPILLKKFSLV